MNKDPEYQFYQGDKKHVLDSLGKEKLLDCLRQMLLIRNFEVRAESAYQMGKVGGFFHAYMGQEAIQTAAVAVAGMDPWYITTYRCHALALLTGVTVNEAMSELYGKANGNAMGRGGSMHFYSDRLLGGFGIVGGHVPIATGAAFSLKYQKKNSVAFCFMGDGAVAQGAVHESLNLAALWDLPCIYVIENNQWGMGTAVSRAIASQPIAESLAKSYGMKAYTVNGTDFFDCYSCFEEVIAEMKKTNRPVLIEAVTERFRGHSISDPGLYRSKEDLKEIMEQKDPIQLLFHALEEKKMITEEAFKALDKEQKDLAKAAMEHAENSPWPDLHTLEEDVFAP